jgi:hypothetical protein
LQEESVITRTVRAAPGVLAPGHIGELTQVIDFALVDAVLEETGARERRRRLLPSRVVVYFVLALALFEECSYQAVWASLTAGLGGLGPGRPAASSLCRARRRIGTGPLRALFEVLAGPVGLPGQPGVFYRGLRTVAVDGTHLHVPDDPAITWRYPARGRAAEVSATRCCAWRPWSSAAPRRAGRRVRPGGRRRAGLRRRGAGRARRDHAAAGRRRVRRRGIRARRHRDRRAVPGPLRRPPLPHPLRHLPDGSYLARIGYGVLPALLAVRVIDAAVTITLADGTTRTEHWRLLTSLPGHARYPAAELIALYHERWQAETTYYSIKATILDGRVLRSRSLPGTDQETWALLTVYQALIRRHRRHPPRLGHRPDQLHHLAADRRRPGHHRHRHPARRPARPRRPDRPGRPGRPAPRPAPAPHPQEPNHQVPPPHRTARPTPSPPASPSSKKDLRPAHDAKRNGVDGNVEGATSSARTRIAHVHEDH